MVKRGRPLKHRSKTEWLIKLRSLECSARRRARPLKDWMQLEIAIAESKRLARLNLEKLSNAK
jgi:hypothetical protein